jgi:pilus assembly protein CpaE
MGSNNNRSLRLVVIDSDAATRADVKRWLGGNGVRVVGESDDVKAGLRLARGLQPDLVLLELPSMVPSAMEFVKRIRQELPGTGLILSAADASPSLILSCIRAGAQEFVARPIDAGELDKAISHIKQLSVVPISGKKRGKLISVFSSKGGIGATSFAANLGLALAQRTAAKVALVDMSFQIGDLGVMLDLAPRYSLTDALVDGAVEESKLRSVLVEHGSGVHLLTAAASPEIAEEITRQHVVELMSTLSTMFDYVVIDIGRQLDDRTVEVLEVSDAIMLVSSLDLPAIRNTTCYLSILNKLHIDQERTHIIINRFHKKSRLSLDNVETMIDRKMFWAIPNDYDPMSLGIDRGIPAVSLVPRSKVAKSYHDLADRIHAMSVAENSSHPIEAVS